MHYIQFANNKLLEVNKYRSRSTSTKKAIAILNGGIVAFWRVKRFHADTFKFFPMLIDRAKVPNLK